MRGPRFLTSLLAGFFLVGMALTRRRRKKRRLARQQASRARRAARRPVG